MDYARRKATLRISFPVSRLLVILSAVWFVFVWHSAPADTIRNSQTTRFAASSTGAGIFNDVSENATENLATVNIVSESATKWTRWQQSFTSTISYSNPYRDITLSVTFNGPSGQSIQSFGFWDGGNTFRIRFMFPETGTWTWQTSCSDPTNTGLHNQTGIVEVSNYSGTNPLYSNGYLKISSDKRYLSYDNDTPFFFLADTVWSAPMNATQTDWETFIDNRRDKRFTMMLMLIGLDVSDAQDTVDVNGNAPFLGANVNDLSQWNPLFWQDYERKVQYANDQGIAVTILSVAHPTLKEPTATQLPDLQVFARNLAARFMGNFVVYSPIWDWPYLALGNDIGQALKQATPFHLVTQHPPWFDDVDGNGSNDSVETAERYYDEFYLDFSSLQSGAGWVQKYGYIFDNNLAAQNTIEWLPRLFNREPHKPVINLESVYDSSVRHDPNDPYHSTVSDIYLPRMARSSAYWSVFSGSAGHTFGAGQIYSWGPRSVAPQGGSWTWDVAMDQPSAFEMQYLRDLLDGYQWWRLGPRQDLILSPQPIAWIDRMVLAASEAGDIAMAYLPNNSEINVDMSAFATAMQASWFNPVNKASQLEPNVIPNTSPHTFLKPAAWGDAVLVLVSTSGNQPPILDPIGPQNVVENQTLTIAISASDADGPAPLILTATNLPTGASFTDFGDGTGEFTWTPTTGAAAASPYNVTFTATDDNGNGLSDSETVTITVIPAGGSGALSGTTAIAPASVSLTAEGSSDWIHWARVSATTVDRKAGVTPQITNYVALNGANPSRGKSMASGYSWSDGTPATTASNTRTGLRVYNIDKGFEFTVPADTTTKTLKVYVGTNLARGRLEASLSDGSAVPFVTTVENQFGKSTHVINVSFRAASPGQTLTVRYTLITEYNASVGWVSLDSVALESVGGNQPPILDPIGPQNVVENQTLTIAISASDADGPAPLILTATNLPTGASFTDFGDGTGEFTWTPTTGAAAASPYNVTFTATDDNGNGLSDSETVTITVIPAGGSGALSGTTTIAPANVSLTAEGTSDWIHWARVSATTVDRKAGVTPQITNYVALNGANPSRGTSMNTGYSWSDGTPAATASNTRTGLRVYNIDKGFEFTVPADTTTKTLKVYVGTNLAGGRLEASLSDGSAVPFVTAVENQFGKSTHVINVSFRAASPGQKLTVRYTLITEYDTSTGWVSLDSAGL